MAVVLINRTVQVAKETDEVLSLVVELVKVVRAKGDYTSLVDDLVKAIDGVAEIPKEARENLSAVLASASVRVAEVVAVLLEAPLVPLVGPAKP